MNRKYIAIAGSVVTVSLLIAGGAWYAFKPAAATPAPVERKVLYWHDPMVPGYRSDKPGKSPFMDMDLVPVYADETGAETGVIVRPEIAASMGIRTAKVVRTRAEHRIDADGYVLRDGAGARVLVDLFDRDAAAVRAGLRADIRIPSRPGASWDGHVARVEPDVDIGSRSIKATIRFTSPGAAPRTNDFAEVHIRVPVPGLQLLVPREALIRTGRRTALVLALGDGRFQPVEVTAGTEYGESVEIVDGIKEGDNVVTSGQFLIDSEASVRASFARMAPAGN